MTMPIQGVQANPNVCQGSMEALAVQVICHLVRDVLPK